MRFAVSRPLERVTELIIRVAGVLTLAFVAMVFAFLLREAMPTLLEYRLGDLILGQRWSPTAEPPKFGLLPLILGSALVTAGALALAVPLGIACATFIAEIAPRALRDLMKPTVELLSAVPSVVFGFIGLQLVGPWLKDLLDLPVARFAGLGALMLAYMSLPTIVSVADDAIRAVPWTFRESSMALGATKWQTISRVVLPSARSGIIAAILLGMGRAVGETMTVLMVTGNAPVIPKGLAGLLNPVRTMTATVAAEMGETPYETPHYHALFVVGLMLLLITLATNSIAHWVVQRRPAGET